MNKEENMEKLREIDELLSYIPAKSIDEFSNLNNNKKKNNKINTNHNLLSLNEISNKLNEKIKNFKTNQGKKRSRNNPKFKKGDTPRGKLNGNVKVNDSNSKNKNSNKSNDLMETD